MTEQMPPGWFKNQENRSDDDSDFERRKKRLVEELPTLVARRKENGRAQSFYPYLLVRSVLGDRGDRPVNVPFWESPDIWTAPGSPGTTPAVPASHGGTVMAGQPNTVYAHVWNLGFAPLAGIRVEFYWCNPSLSIDAAHANLIGMARCELAGRGMQGSHKLVKCPTAWVPVVENGGHECLVVRVEGIGDPLGNNSWQPWLNRHVAQRNISVVATATALKLITALDLSRLPRSHVQLIQVGRREGDIAARTVAPGLEVASDVQTLILAELTAANAIVRGESRQASAGMLMPVHPLAEGAAPHYPRGTPEGGIKVIHPMAAFPNLESTERAIGTVHLADLLRSVPRLHSRSLAHEPAREGEVQVLRLASYDRNDHLIGGYTMVLRG